MFARLSLGRCLGLVRRTSTGRLTAPFWRKHAENQDTGDSCRVWRGGVVQHGVIYADQPDIAQHGGADFQDVSVPILVDLPGLQGGTTDSAEVNILQVAPTIVALLGLSPMDLQAVRIEHTQVLPGLSIGQI
jgi:arylsulfatase A-like enzyme